MEERVRHAVSGKRAESLGLRGAFGGRSVRALTALVLLSGMAGVSCSKEESLVTFSLTSDPELPDLKEVTLFVDTVSRTFDLNDGLTSTAIKRGVYVSVTGHVLVRAEATPSGFCPFQASNTVDISSAGATVPVALTLKEQCGDGGAGTSGTGGVVGTGGRGGASGGTAGGVAGNGGGAAGSGGRGGAAGGVAGSGGGVAGNGGGAAGSGGRGGAAGGVAGGSGGAVAGRGGAGGGAAGTGGAAAGTGGAAAGTGGAVAGAGGGAAGASGGTGGGGAVVPPSLDKCTEYDHNAASSLPCNTTSGDGDWIVGSVAFSRDGRFLVSSGQDARVKVWKVEGTTLTPEGHEFSLNRQGYLAFSPDGMILAAGARNRIQMWTVSTWASRTAITGISGDVYDTAFMPDSQGIVSVDSDKNLYLHRLGTGTMSTVVNLPSIPYAVDVSPDGKWVAVGYSNGKLEIYQIQGNTLVSAVNATLTPTTDSINAVRFSPDGGLLAVGSDDSYVRFYSVPLSSASLPEGSSIRPDPSGAQGVNGIAFSSTSRYLVVATGSAFVYGEGSMWEVPTRGPFGGYAVGKYFPISTAFSPGGRAVAFGEVSCGKVMFCAD